MGAVLLSGCQDTTSFKRLRAFQSPGACPPVSITKGEADDDRSIEVEVVSGRCITNWNCNNGLRPSAFFGTPPSICKSKQSLAFIPIPPFFIMHFLRECSGHFQNGCPTAHAPFSPPTAEVVGSILVVWMRSEFTQPCGETEGKSGAREILAL